MTIVLMEKSGQDDIRVESSNVAAHEIIGWTKKKVNISTDGQTVTFPQGAAIAFDVGAVSVTGMQVLHYAITPAAASATAVHAAVTLHATLPTVVTNDITNPDVPRTLRVKGNAANEAGDVVVVGKDILGVSISETIALDAANAVDGLKAFASVSQITLPPRTTAADTVSIGYSNFFGMPQVLKNGAYLFAKLFDGSADLGTLTLDADIALNLYEVAGTPNGSKVIDLVYFD